METISRLGVDHLTNLLLSPRDFIREAAGAGFYSVSLRTIHVAGGEPAWADEPVDGKELARVAADLGVGIHAVESITFTEDIDTKFDAIKKHYELASDLQVKYVYCFADDSDEARCADNFGRLAGEAARFGLELLLEPMPYRGVKTLDAALRVVQQADVHAGLIVDTLHSTRGGTSAAMLADFPAERLAVLQLCDAPLKAPEAPSPSGLHPLMHEARHNRLQPGEGELPLQDFIAAMPDEAIVVIEAPATGGNGGSAITLSDVFQKAQYLLDGGNK